jgi:hypothetical protein
MKRQSLISDSKTTALARGRLVDSGTCHAAPLNYPRESHSAARP